MKENENMKTNKMKEEGEGKRNKKEEEGRRRKKEEEGGQFPGCSSHTRSTRPCRT